VPAAPPFVNERQRKSNFQLLLCSKVPHKCQKTPGIAHLFLQSPRVEFCIQGAILRLSAQVPLASLSYAGTADRFQQEVTMESTTLTGPVLYLLIAWGIITAIFVILFIWRSVLSSHEDDQIFLGTAEEHMAREQRELVVKITKLSRPLLISGVLSGALLLLAGGLWIYQGLKQNF